MSKPRSVEEIARELLDGLRAINGHRGYEFTQPLARAERDITAALQAERAAREAAERERDTEREKGGKLEEARAGWGATSHQATHWEARAQRQEASTCMLRDAVVKARDWCLEDVRGRMRNEALADELSRALGAALRATPTPPEEPQT